MSSAQSAADRRDLLYPELYTKLCTKLRTKLYPKLCPSSAHRMPNGQGRWQPML
jgi:hypothetical protein